MHLISLMILLIQRSSLKGKFCLLLNVCVKNVTAIIRDRLKTPEVVTDLTLVLNFISFTFVRWKNDKNVQLRDFSSKIGQCFSLRNNHKIQIITVSMCL